MSAPLRLPAPASPAAGVLFRAVALIVASGRLGEFAEGAQIWNATRAARRALPPPERAASRQEVVDALVRQVGAASPLVRLAGDLAGPDDG